MNFLDFEAEDAGNPPISSAWYSAYFTLSAIYIIFTIVYFYYSRYDFCSSSTLKWGKISCGLFLGALLFKSIGYCVSGTLIIKENHLLKEYKKCDETDNKSVSDFAMVFLQILANPEGDRKLDDLYNTYSKVFMVFSSFPGYCIAAAYCMIFYNWCSICIEVMEKKSSSVYGKSRCVFTSLLIGIGICFILSTLLFCFIGNKQFHIAEAVFAIIRDLSLAIAFIIYLTKIWQVFADPCGSVKSFFKKIFCCECSNSSKNRRQESLNSFINYESHCNDDDNSESNPRSSRYSSRTPNNNLYETALVLMCLSIVVGLIARAISITFYTIITNNNNLKGNICDAVGNPEYTMGYFIVFIFETIISELLPVIAIITYRIFQPSMPQVLDNNLSF